MNNSIGTGTNGYSVRTEEYKNTKLPKYTQTFWGKTESDVKSIGGAFYNAGWTVKYTNGNPWTGEATYEGEVSNDGQTPDTGSSDSVKFNWSLRFNSCDKEILHCNKGAISWIDDISDDNKNILEKYIATPPTTIEEKAELTHCLGEDSSNESNVWKMMKRGYRNVSIHSPVLRLTIEAYDGYSIEEYSSMVGTIYTKSDIVGSWNVPSNFADSMPQHDNPDSSGTGGIAMEYGWLFLPPNADQRDSKISIQYEWAYGLYPSCIYS